jgi:glycosyltransferase involved in cell wall biosynthesis
MTGYIKDLTLCIPIHNGRKWIEEQAKSVQFQSALPSYVIIFDDGSVENSEEYIKLHWEWYKGKFVFVYFPEPMGTGAIYNELIKATATEFLQILDQDDLLERDYFSCIQEVIEGIELESTNQCLPIIVSGMTSNSAPLSIFNRLIRVFVGRKTQLPIWLPVLGWCATRSGVIYPTRLAKALPFDEPAFPGSDVLQLHRLRQQSQAIYVKNARVRYRIHEDSQSSSASYEPLNLSKIYRLESRIRFLMSRILR